MALHPGKSEPDHAKRTSPEVDPIQRALRDNEDWYRDLVEHSQDLLCVHDLRGRLLIVNPAPARVLGYSVEEILKISMREIIVPEFRDAFDAYLQQIASKGEAHGLMAVLTRSGERRIWEFQNTLRTEGVAAPIVRGRAHDVTERVRAEKSLRDANAKLMREVEEREQAAEELRKTSNELRMAKEKLAEEKLYLEQEIDQELGLDEIVGQSKALKDVMEQVGKVAASDATVLLLGETGTGKELIARAVHRRSLRSANSCIKLNCAAIPSGLLESELFGHEKGAFTGAVSKKIGRIELADKGTLFLDEVGEIPLSLQPKLLRVLQDHEFERLGSTHTLKVDFRLIAATNRDLAACVQQQQFRSDLYYRLSVFPIRVPPLRERRADIPLLIEHFVARCGRRMKKSIVSVPKATIDALIHWDWPGNVRELENFIERSVILTRGSVLEAPLGELQAIARPAPEDEAESAERERILRVLDETRGKVRGNRGAAARLGMLPSTLFSKLKRLRIDPERYQD
jgi:formate hydrogenlyase transcriptional activator